MDHSYAFRIDELLPHAHVGWRRRLPPSCNTNERCGWLTRWDFHWLSDL